MKKTKNIMTIDTIGKKEKRLNHLKDNYFLFGDLVMRKRRNTLLLFHGIPNTKIFSLYLWVVMILRNKKQVKYWFGLSRMLRSPSINMKAYQQESCVWIGILLPLLFWQLVFMMELFWFMM
jgi:predicted small integral membrane protein